MRRLFVIVFLLLAVVPALAWHHGSAVGGGGGGGACPFGALLGDGCPGASASAGTQTTGFFASFPQNGQTYQTASFTGSVSGTTLTVSGVTGTINPNSHVDTLLGTGIPAGTTIVAGSGTSWTLSANLGTVGSEAMTSQFRPPWNVAGVDYPVGAPTSGLTDPSTLNTCSGTSFPICLASGHTNIVEIVAATSGSNAVVDHYDFSLHGGYLLLLDYAVTGNLSITNNKFAGGSAFQSVGPGDVYAYYSGCNSVMFDANSRADTVAGTTTITGNEFDGKADTGGATINCPNGAVFNVWPTGPTNSVIVEYNYFHDYNPRIQFGYGATIKYNLFSNNNYNTANHGELTAFNELCGQLTGCPGVSTIDLEYNLITQGDAYCGGQTAPVFLGSGLISGQTTDVTAKNNVFLNNGCGMTSVSLSSPNQTGCAGTSADGANCQITFTTVDGVAGSNTFTLRDGNICSAAGTAGGYMSCPALLQGQLSGTTGGSGTYRYSNGGTALGSATSMWLAVSSSPSIFMTGETYRNVVSENNYIDGTGAGNFAVEPQSIGDCAVNSTSAIRNPASGTITSTGNWWMTGTLFNGGPNESYGQFSFTNCLKFAEGLFNPGSISGTTLSAGSPVTFNGSISGQTLTVNSGTAPAAGDTITDGGVNIPPGLQVNCFPDCGPTNFTVSNSLTVSSETMYGGTFYGTVNGNAFFSSAAAGRTDRLFGNGVTPGTITFSSCTPTSCTLSSSPGTLSSRNFSALVP